jgi:glutamate racemase
MLTTETPGTIGILDSGIGGLSVLRHIKAELPNEHLLYLADQAHVPYGSRSHDEISRYITGITRLFLDNQAKLIVVACNTASAAALDTLRQTFPALPIVGMEPAIKPAAAQTRSGKIGVLATPGTFHSRRYVSLVTRYGQDIEVFEDPCIGLVELIEAGAFSDPATEQLLRRILEPMLQSGVDTLVLGCTHYPFVLPLLQSITQSIGQSIAQSISGESVIVIDPAPAVARQAKNVLQHHQIGAPVNQEGSLCCYTTGNLSNLQSLCGRLLGQPCMTRTAVWVGDTLIAQRCE